MKFAYVAAALLGLAYGNTIVSEAPETDSLAFRGVPEVEDVALLEREDAGLYEAVEDVFAMIEEREAEASIDDEFEEETTELQARSAASILSALKKVNAQVTAVNKKLNTIPKNKKASTKKALALRQQASKLSNAINAATSAANSSGKVNAKDSKKIFKYVAGPLKSNTLKSLKNFIAHKQAFKKGNFSGVVKSSLQQLQGQVRSLANALIAKAGSASVKKQGKKVAAQINGAFNKAIAAF